MIASPVALARTYIGVPFQHQGRTRNGIDCVGLLIEVFRACGRDVVDLEGYARHPHDGLLEQMVDANNCAHVAKGDWREGDVALIAFAQRNERGKLVRVVRHAALLTDYPMGGFGLLHTHAGLGRVTEHRLDPRWEKLIVQVRRPMESV